MSEPPPDYLSVSLSYLSLLHRYAAEVEAELDRLDELTRRDLELGRQPDWLGAYLDLRVPVEILVLFMWGILTDPRLTTSARQSPSSPNPAEPSSLKAADG